MSITDPQQNISVKMTFYFNILKVNFGIFLRMTHIVLGTDLRKTSTFISTLHLATS